MLLWAGFSAVVGVIGVYSGLCRDRLEYLCHLPNPPGAWVYARLITLQLGIIGTAATLLLGSALLLRGAGASPLLLFLFQVRARLRVRVRVGVRVRVAGRTR